MPTYRLPPEIDGTPRKYLGQDYVMPDPPKPPYIRKPPPPGEVSYGDELGAHRRVGQRAILESKQHYQEHMQDEGLGVPPGSKLVYDPRNKGYIVGSPDIVHDAGPYGSATGSPDFDDKSKGLTPDVHDPGWFAHDPLRVRAPRRHPGLQGVSTFEPPPGPSDDDDKKPDEILGRSFHSFAKGIHDVDPNMEFMPAYPEPGPLIQPDQHGVFPASRRHPGMHNIAGSMADWANGNPGSGGRPRPRPDQMRFPPYLEESAEGISQAPRGIYEGTRETIKGFPGRYSAGYESVNRDAPGAMGTFNRVIGAPLAGAYNALAGSPAGQAAADIALSGAPLTRGFANDRAARPVDTSRDVGSRMDEGGPGISGGQAGREEADEPSGLVVTRRRTDGTIQYGEPGQVHFDLLRNAEDLPGRAGTMEKYNKLNMEDLGFAEPGGPFMSRHEALEWVNKNEPEEASTLKHSQGYEGGGLEGGEYKKKWIKDPVTGVDIEVKRQATAAVKNKVIIHTRAHVD